ncbi:phosphoadenosine phosphosulfate reductase family protein [Ruminococcaceae bacterium OttesenSCG-928-A11]|nr:phosphoadenosine phosphosulfate reductase family protein [Ruminococcaceae bacterium OttesenSCG-928-A11]
MDKVQAAIKRIQYAAELAKGADRGRLVCAYSGGKDSDVLLELMLRSGVNFEISHSHTTADAPQTVYHTREVLARMEGLGVPVYVHYPIYKKQRISLWQLIPEKGMPMTRIQRYCCTALKRQGKGRAVELTGVRWDESTRRKKTRGFFETYTSNIDNKLVMQNDTDENRNSFSIAAQRYKPIVNPIVDFTNEELWDFIESEHICMNPLYKMGFTRCGCIGCPMGGKKRWFEFEMFPKFEQMYRRSFAKMLELRKIRRPDAPTNWKTADDVFDWWMEGPRPAHMPLPGEVL